MEPKSKTKVVFLITKSNWGGAQRYVYDLATSLSSLEYDVVVALGGTGVLHERLRNASIRTITLSTLERDVSLRKDWNTFSGIRALIAEEHPDVLHVNSSKAGGLGALAGRISRVPAIIYTAHGWAFNENRGWLNRLVVKFFHWLTIILSHRTIAVSQAIKTQFQWPLVQARMSVIHNGIAPPIFMNQTNARAELSTQLPILKKHQADPWGVTIAELHPVKQHDITIKAVASLRDQGISYRHIIIGGGEQLHELKKLVENYDLEEHVFLAGHHTDAARWLHAFDVFVLSSRSEALGYVLLEALAAELPIIASNVGGIPEIVPNENPHRLVPAGDVAALGNAIKHTLAIIAAPHTPAAVPTLETMTTATTHEYQAVLQSY